MKHADILAVLAAHGVQDTQLADIKIHLSKRRANESTECLACRSRSLSGDFACGKCSTIKAKREPQFWGDVQNREAGGIGRTIPRKPDPTKFSVFKVERKFGPAEKAREVQRPFRRWRATVDVKEPMVTADDFFTRRIVVTVDATSAEDARSRARMMTGFYPVSVVEVA